MDGNNAGTVILNEPSSAFDPDRDVKDRKLAQIFKKLHMEEDLKTLLQFDDDIRRPSEVVSNHSEELSMSKLERCRPRKILDYAQLAKGKGYGSIGSFASNYSPVDDSDKNSSGSKRIRFQKHRFDDYIPTLNPKRRSRTGQQGSSLKKTRKLQRSSFPSIMDGTGKRRMLRSRSFTHGIKAGILKRRMKHADNIKQAFIMTQSAVATQSEEFVEFVLPKEWIKEVEKTKETKKRSSEEGEGAGSSGSSSSSSSKSVEDLAMERLVAAFKTAKRLYPDKFAKYFPDFMHCFETNESKETTGKQSDAMLKGKHSKAEGTATSGINGTSESSEESSTAKITRKMSKTLKDHKTSAEIERKKSENVLGKEKISEEQVTEVQKIARINGSSAGTSGLRKRTRTSIYSSISHSKSQLNSGTENTGNSEGTNKSSVPKRRRCTKAATRFSDASASKTTDSSVAAVRSNIEDSATESSSDESGNVRASKRQRAQTGFYKTMVSLYDKKR